MTRVILATIATIGFALPSLAADTPANTADQAAAHSAELSNAAAAKQAQLILAQKGYVNVAITDRDDNGRWTGTAFKDGKMVFVAVDLKKASVAAESKSN